MRDPREHRSAPPFAVIFVKNTCLIKLCHPQLTFLSPRYTLGSSKEALGGDSHRATIGTQCLCPLTPTSDLRDQDAHTCLVVLSVVLRRIVETLIVHIGPRTVSGGIQGTRTMLFPPEK